MWANGQYQFSQTCACGPHHQNESCHDELVVLYHFTVVSTGCLLLFFVVVFFVFVYAEREEVYNKAGCGCETLPRRALN